MLKQVSSEIIALGAPYSYHVKLIFDLKHISGFKIFKGIFLEWILPQNMFVSGSEMEKTAKLSQNCPKKALRNFCKFDFRRLKQKPL